jgi:hypothetical protein
MFYAANICKSFTYSYELYTILKISFAQAGV